MIGDKDAVRKDKALLMQALRDMNVQKFVGNRCRCPFHDDSHASAGIYRTEEGFWKFKCQKCDNPPWDYFDIEAQRTGRKVEDILRDLKRKQLEPPRKAEARVYPDIDAVRRAYSATPMGKLHAIYRYTDEAQDQERPDVIVLRIVAGDGTKTFLQGRPVPDGFVMEGPAKPWPLYNRSRIKDADTVWVVEGEKAAHALHPYLPEGHAVTTSLGGAGKADSCDWTPLEGKKAILWPDHDPVDAKLGYRVGIKHMEDVYRLLEALAQPAESFWIDPEALGVPLKGDAVEFLALYPTDDEKRDAVTDLANHLESLGADREVRQIIDDTIAGKRRTLRLPWLALTTETKATLPGTVTAICGDPGSTKSFAVLECSWQWHFEGIPVALLELEETRGFHLYRALGQFTGNASLTDDDWVAAHPEEASAIADEFNWFTREFGRCIHTPPRDKDFTRKDAAAWVERMAKAGKRIIVIDPITATDDEDDASWKEDKALIRACGRIAAQHQCSIFLVTHPRKFKDKGLPSLDDLQGGTAYQRFVQTVIWLLRCDREAYRMRGENDAMFTDWVDRIALILKARNARGAGKRVGFVFDPKTFRLIEKGIILKDQKGASSSEIGQSDDVPT